MTFLDLTLVSFVAWFLSTLAGGGSPFVLIPLINWMLGAAAVPPVITVGMLLGNAQRVFLFWKDIDWQVTLWYLPGAISGAVLGSYAFVQLQLNWLQLAIGLFLVLSVFTYGFGSKERSFRVRLWQFLPVGFLYAFVSGLIGSTGPVMNPFYLNYGLVKEQMIATKSLNVLVIHIAKLVAYASFGVLTTEHLQYGLVIGLGAIPANLLGQVVLRRMNDRLFRQLVIAMMTLSGAWMLVEQRDVLGIGL